MFIQALFAYLHYISIITLILTIALELILFKSSMTYKEARTIQRADGIYGLSAILVVATGFIRLIYFEKGWDYYFSNHIFMTKLGLFIIVGLLSIFPTRVFLKWRKELASKPDILDVSRLTTSRIKRVLWIEMILVVLLPFLAALMARGMGYTG